MNKIQQLIEKLCPNGVEFKTLGEVGVFIRGNGLQKKDFVDNGVGCIHYGQIYTHYDIHANKTKSFITKELAQKLRKAQQGDLIIATTSENAKDVCKAVAWLGKDEVAISGDAYIFKHNLNPKYVSYFFTTPMFFNQKKKFITGTKVLRVSGKNLEKIQIPIPPLPVQKEIVKILDTFSALEAELEAELEARKKQYEYYREKLLSFGDEVEWKELGEVLTYEQPTKFIVKSTNYDDSFLVPVLTAGKSFILGYTNEKTGIYNASKESPVIIFDDFTTSFHWVDFNFKVKSSALKIIYPKANINTIDFRFIYFAMTCIKFQAMDHVRHWISKYSKYKIPIPPLSEQKRIVGILDKFDALVNDLSAGLPAEIEARRKQYEYYRDRLLTFKEKEKEHVPA